MPMILAVGAAFNSDNLIYNLKWDKLKLTCAQCVKSIGDAHRDRTVKKIFRECIKLVIEDVIENNVTFWLPTGSRKCNIHMMRTTGDDFKNLRRHGKWRDVDLLSSYFTGYQLGFFMYGNRTPRTKRIYLNKYYKDRITEYTNQGRGYGEGKIDKKLQDYYEPIQKMFPYIKFNDIKRILNFCWKSLYLHNSYGGDTFITDDDLWFYIGKLHKSSLKYFEYYKRKLSTKIRVTYRRKKIPWDGYYYFALSNKQYENYLSQKNPKGRPKKYFQLGNIKLYQILDDCKVCESDKRYIFRIPYIAKINFTIFEYNFKASNFELIIQRNPWTFKDLIYNDYDFI